jgi:FtsP/CotA-like multicopper oxidase with cupredoxin domain
MESRSSYISSMVRKSKACDKSCRNMLIPMIEEFPGPTIEARSGDTLVVEVVNKLQDDEGVSLHWHGLHMRGKISSSLTGNMY